MLVLCFFIDNLKFFGSKLYFWILYTWRSIMKKNFKECVLYLLLLSLLMSLICYLFSIRGDSSLFFAEFAFFIMLCPAVSAILVENGFDFKIIFKSKFNIAYLIFFPISILFFVFKTEKNAPIFQLIFFMAQLLGLYLLTVKDKKLVGKISLKNFFKWSALLLLLLSIQAVVWSLYINGNVNFYNIFINNFAVLISLPTVMLNIIFAIGQEYGWRQFLQPRLQSMIGKVSGVLLKGVIWGISNIPLFVMVNSEVIIYDILAMLMYYVFIGIFIGLCYMKTKSIILVSMLSLINGAFVVLRNATYTTENISMNSFYIMAIAVSFVIFVPFLFSKEFRNGDSI